LLIAEEVPATSESVPLIGKFYVALFKLKQWGTRWTITATWRCEHCDRILYFLRLFSVNSCSKITQIGVRGSFKIAPE
jgi:hypothetical protein